MLIETKFVKLTMHAQKLSYKGTVYTYKYTHLYTSEKYEFVVHSISKVMLATFYTFST